MVASLILIRYLLVPGTQQLFLTYVTKTEYYKFVLLFLLPRKLLDNSLPLQSAYL